MLELFEYQSPRGRAIPADRRLKDGTSSEALEFFDLTLPAIQKGLVLNCSGVLLPCQFIGRESAGRKSGAILTISLVAGLMPLARAITDSDTKAAVNSLIRWLAVHMAANCSTNIRVHALAPRSIPTEQNCFLLRDEARQCLSPRGQRILQSIPMARLGRPEEIVGAALWLVSEHDSFVRGATTPCGGGWTRSWMWQTAGVQSAGLAGNAMFEQGGS